jgi:TonB family protein
MRKALLLFSVAVLHALGVWAFIHATPFSSRIADAGALITVFIQPTISKGARSETTPDMSRLSYRIATPVSVLHMDVPEIEFEVTRNAGATSAAPSLDAEPRVDMGPFVRSAALLPGEGATVVLRIEVLKDGSPGQISVDVSSGSKQVDNAAVAYARERRWEPAMVAGIARSMWVRWGVRLQA